MTRRLLRVQARVMRVSRSRPVDLRGSRAEVTELKQRKKLANCRTFLNHFSFSLSFVTNTRSYLRMAIHAVILSSSCETSHRDISLRLWLWIKLSARSIQVGVMLTCGVLMRVFENCVRCFQLRDLEMFVMARSNVGSILPRLSQRTTNSVDSLLQQKIMTPRERKQMTETKKSAYNSTGL